MTACAVSAIDDRSSAVIVACTVPSAVLSAITLQPARVPETYELTPWRTNAGTTIFAPFQEDTSYFGDPKLQWMINFRVRDIQKMTDQLRAQGIEVELDAEVYPNGRFARMSDPEGNPIQLWQPGGKDPG